MLGISDVIDTPIDNGQNLNLEGVIQNQEIRCPGIPYTNDIYLKSKSLTAKIHMNKVKQHKFFK